MINQIDLIQQGDSRYVRYENDPNLAQYMTQDKFNKLKENMESKSKITLIETKDFFQIEACLTAMSYCIQQLQQIAQ